MTKQYFTKDEVVALARKCGYGKTITSKKLREFDLESRADELHALCVMAAQVAIEKLVEDKAGGEPVAWMREGWGPDCGPYVEFYRDDEMGWRDRKEWTPLYTRPQPQADDSQKEAWRGLSDAEWMNIVNKNQAWFGVRPEEVAHEVCKLTEEKLREKNAKPAEQQEATCKQSLQVAAATKAGGDEPVEFWNAVDGWVSVPAESADKPAAWVYPEFWEHLEKVGCGTAYRTEGDGRHPLFTRSQPQADVPEVGFGNMKGENE